MVDILQRCDVAFDEYAHTYTAADGTPLSGITSILHRQLFADKYADIPQHILDAAAAYGANVHERIELADALDADDADDAIVTAYRRIKADNALTTLTNEYLVTDGRHVASSIDIVFDGFHLCDVKTTSKLDTKYVAYQLSIYAWLFELQNPGLKAGRLYALWLPKPHYGQPALVEVPRIPSDIVASLIDADIRGEQWQEPDDVKALFTLPAVADTDSLPAPVAEAVKAVIEIESLAKAYKERSATLRQGLQQLMEQDGVTKFANDAISITYKAESVRSSFDAKAFAADHPELYEQYLKQSTVQPSLLIKIK